MDLEIINIYLISDLIHKAEDSERLRVAYDLRNSPEDTSQRMLNALMPGTEVPIHRHEETNETSICVYGKLSVHIYEQQPDGTFNQTDMVILDPSCGSYGIQIPKGVWHNVKAISPTLICEMKDGKFVAPSSMQK